MIGFMVPPEDLSQTKDAVMPFLLLGENSDPGRVTAESLWNEIEALQCQLWLVVDDTLRGICVTSIERYPALKACSIRLCAGEGVKDWVHLLMTDVEPWAMDNGCEVMEGRMRKGWKRMLPDYSVRHEHMEKRL